MRGLGKTSPSSALDTEEVQTPGGRWKQEAPTAPEGALLSSREGWSQHRVRALKPVIEI